VTTILQLDFDGTLVHGDVNEAIFRRFAGEEWSDGIEAASRQLTRDPSSPALIAALKQASAHLIASDAECLDFVEKHNPPRDGLQDLIETAKRLRMECHIVSYGFEFYIRHYLDLAGVSGQVEVHAGKTEQASKGRLLRYLGPDGQEVSTGWKVVWTREFRRRADLLIYVGDGGSDVAPAQLCDAVFARDKLLARITQTYSGVVQAFETLHEIARGLESLPS
jgi:2-hydroxy-3-keto-5-methylthiopentenyl-1-phosphate phosphatase